jgi:hypothetical protein
MSFGPVRIRSDLISPMGSPVNREFATPLRYLQLLDTRTTPHQ